MTMTLDRIPETDTDTAAEPSPGPGRVETADGCLPLVGLGCIADITGLACRTSIIQTFINPSTRPIEATYVFPLDGTAAVTACEMIVDGRVIRARLKEREQARADYRTAVAAGYRATLLEEDQPETFKMSIGNLPPGGSVRVRITTVSRLPVADGRWTLRLPLVIAPRYRRAMRWPETEIETAGRTYLDGNAAPVDLAIAVRVDPGTMHNAADWYRGLSTTLHSTVIDGDAEESEFSKSEAAPVVVTLEHCEQIDRDFILRGPAGDGDETVSAIFQPDREDATEVTVAVDLVPPPPPPAAPRDVVVLIDQSGSMEGWKLRSAIDAAVSVLQSLSDRDQFAVLGFCHNLHPYLADSRRAGSWGLRAATPAAIAGAVRWLRRRRTTGGTEMEAAIKHATRPLVESNHGSIVLITDGQITDEDGCVAMLAAIPEHRRPRLHAIGIDRAVNASVLRRVAAATGGTFELAETPARLAEVIGNVSSRIGNPSLTDVKIEADDEISEPSPRSVSAVYAGSAVTLYARMKVRQWPPTVRVTGKRPGGEVWSARRIAHLAADQPDDARPMLRSLHGRTRVRELEDRWVSTRDDSLRSAIIDASLAAGVLSRLTAFVAVDDSQRVTDGGWPITVDQPLHYPEGWVRRLGWMIAAVPAIDWAAIHQAEAAVKFDAKSFTIEIDDDALELIPESVARENSVIPVRLLLDGTLLLAAADADDVELAEKLRFILNRRVRLQTADRHAIGQAIDEHYGQIDGESADSMLQEFTDTAIDFTETCDFMAASPMMDGGTLDAADAGWDGDLAPPLMAAPPQRDLPPSKPIRRRAKAAAPDAGGSPHEQTPIVRLVQLILAEAVQFGAEAIELRRTDEAIEIDYIIDGSIVPRERAPSRLWSALAARIAILAHLPIAGYRGATGQLRITVGSAEVDFEVTFSEDGKSIHIICRCKTG